jgi:hypothetical protein
MKMIIGLAMYAALICVVILFFMGANSRPKPLPPRDQK